MISPPISALTSLQYNPYQKIGQNVYKINVPIPKPGFILNAVKLHNESRQKAG
jgi:hypothetical protein